MPRALLRKLTDLTSGEDLAELKAKLEAQKIPMEFQICERKQVDFYRVFVYIGHLQAAKEILHDSVMAHNAALFARGQKNRPSSRQRFFRCQLVRRVPESPK